jgi:LemA protein
VKTTEILRTLYGIRPRRHRLRSRFSLRGLRLAVARFVDRYSWRLAFGTMAFGAWGVGHIYFYNRLTLLEFEVQATWAQVETVQERRSHIERNLTHLLRYAAAHERDVVTDVTKLRTGPPDDQANTQRGWKLLGELEAVAEAYPALQLAQSVQQFSGIIVQTETEISLRIAAYNTAVNMYTSELFMFPGNLFGKALGFETYEFYRPEDPSILQYREVDP